MWHGPQAEAEALRATFSDAESLTLWRIPARPSAERTRERGPTDLVLLRSRGIGKSEWWRDEGQGYTSSREAAHRYRRARAEAIARTISGAEIVELEESEQSATDEVYIVSGVTGEWWLEEGEGTTRDLERAHLYTRARAEQILQSQPYCHIAEIADAQRHESLSNPSLCRQLGDREWRRVANNQAAMVLRELGDESRLPEGSGATVLSEEKRRLIVDLLRSMTQ